MNDFQKALHDRVNDETINPPIFIEFQLVHDSDIENENAQKKIDLLNIQIGRFVFAHDLFVAYVNVPFWFWRLGVSLIPSYFIPKWSEENE